MISEGQSYSYVGDDHLVGVGAVGRVLSASGSAAHVQWATGGRVGHVDLVEGDDLLPAMAPAVAAQTLADEFALAPTQGIQARAAYESGGMPGVLGALDSVGHLAVLSEYATEAVEHLAGRLRSDPTFAQVMADLGDQAGEAALVAVATTLLRDQVDGGEDG